MHEGVPIAIWVNFPPLVFFSLYPFEKHKGVCDEDNWLAGRRGWARRRETNDLLTPSFAEGTLALEETTCCGLFFFFYKQAQAVLERQPLDLHGSGV